MKNSLLGTFPYLRKIVEKKFDCLVPHKNAGAILRVDLPKAIESMLQQLKVIELNGKVSKFFKNYHLADQWSRKIAGDFLKMNACSNFGT